VQEIWPKKGHIHSQYQIPLRIGGCQSGVNSGQRAPPGIDILDNRTNLCEFFRAAHNPGVGGDRTCKVQSTCQERASAQLQKGLVPAHA
jgi:hypothetical protein